jgi:hypothetical protein
VKIIQLFHQFDFDINGERWLFGKKTRWWDDRIDLVSSRSADAVSQILTTILRRTQYSTMDSKKAWRLIWRNKILSMSWDSFRFGWCSDKSIFVIIIIFLSFPAWIPPPGNWFPYAVWTVSVILYTYKDNSYLYTICIEASGTENGGRQPSYAAGQETGVCLCPDRASRYSPVRLVFLQIKTSRRTTQQRSGWRPVQYKYTLSPAE